MKFYVAEYRITDGADEYVEYGLLASRTFETALKRAEIGRRFFNHYGWVETCRLKRLQEIPEAEYNILKKYFFKI
jgi:hypothetical protein